MLSLKKSLNILKKTDALLEGHFVLSSGLHSPKYIQCAKLLSFPNLADKICKSLANKIKKNFKKIDLILAPAMGGVIIGYEIGKISLECVKIIKKSNAKLVGFASIIDRSSKKSLKIKNKIISHLKIDVPSYNLKNIPKSLKSIPITTPGSRFIK